LSTLDYLRFVSALVFVLALIGALAWAVRRFGLAGRLGAPRSQGRLSVVEVAALDARRRLVLVRRDTTEHLLLIGPTSELVVEAGIRPPAGFADALKSADQPPGSAS
jgi:flagellar protein FliO/FliZ